MKQTAYKSSSVFIQNEVKGFIEKLIFSKDAHHIWCQSFVIINDHKLVQTIWLRGKTILKRISILYSNWLHVDNTSICINEFHLRLSFN